MNCKTRARQLQMDIPVVFLALKDERTPFFAKLAGAVAVAYALSPIDLIPDFIPVLGYLDDLILLPALIALTVKMIPTEVLEEHREKAKHIWDCGKPQKWFCAVPIFVIWLAIVIIAIKLIWR